MLIGVCFATLTKTDIVLCDTPLRVCEHLILVLVRRRKSNDCSLQKIYLQRGVAV